MTIFRQPGSYLAVGAIILVSGVVNAWYGWSIGRSLSLFEIGAFDFHMGFLIAAAGVAFDVLKCVIPIKAISIFYGDSRAKAYFVTLSIALWAVASFYSWQAASSAALLARTKISGHSQDLIKQRAELEKWQTSLEGAQAKLEAKIENPWSAEIQIYKSTPIKALSDMISEKERTDLFKWSKQCAAPYNDKGRDFCDSYKLLKLARDWAEEGERAKGELRQTGVELKGVKDQLRALVEKGVPVSADPIVEAYAKETGWTEDKVRARQSMYVGLAIELFANIGMAYFAWFLILAGRETQPEIRKDPEVLKVQEVWKAREIREDPEKSGCPENPEIQEDPDNLLAAAYPRREPETESETPPKIAACDSAPPPRVTEKLKIVEGKKRVTVREIVQLALNDLARKPGDYTLEEMRDRCVTIADRIARKSGAIVPKVIKPGSKQFTDLGAKKQKRPGYADADGRRPTRYRIEAGEPKGGLVEAA